MKHSIPLPIVYHPRYSIDWPAGHRFPMQKYRLLYELLCKEQLVSRYHLPNLATQGQLECAHDAAYIARFLNGELSLREEKKLGFPWSEPLRQRTLAAVGGTIRTCHLALTHGLACNLSGGTHHAKHDSGEGFCVFNDIAVAAVWMLQRKRVRQILILDCDVHQGDGTADILRTTTGTFTCSIHARRNYPFTKTRSDLDVEVEDDTGDSEYLQLLTTTLIRLEQNPKPDLLIYDAGSDVHRDDRLGRLVLSDAGIQARDQMVLNWAARQGIPVALLIGGGYDHDHQQLARRHALSIRTASEHFALRNETQQISRDKRL